MDTTYLRVIPRDLFNESKLLKCIGRLVLMIHDGYNINGLLKFTHDEQSFKIGLHNEGYLQVSNIIFYIKDERVDFVTTYNSKASYPLAAYYKYCEYPVFDEQGNYTDEFIEFCTEF